MTLNSIREFFKQNKSPKIDYILIFYGVLGVVHDLLNVVKWHHLMQTLQAVIAHFESCDDLLI